MGKYKSGLSYDKLKMAADNNALDTLTKGNFKKNGKHLQACLSYKDAEGKRRYLAHNISDTKASGRGRTGVDAKAKILAEWRELVVADIKAVASIHDDPTVSVSTALEYFIESKDKRDGNGIHVGVRASSLTFYRYAAKRVGVLPRLATMPLKDVTKRDVEELVTVMATGASGKQYTTKSIRDTLNVLSQVFRHYQLPNPCEGVSLPQNAARSKREDSSTMPNTLTEETVRRLNTLLDERERKSIGIDNVVLGARIALHTGLRAEEVSGLRWRDVDLLNGYLFVRNVIERAEVQETDQNGNVVTKYREFDAQPKTVGSRRDIPLDAELLKVLSDTRVRFVETLRVQHPRMKDGSIEKLASSSYVLSKPVTDENGKVTHYTHYSPHRLGVNFRKWAGRVGVVGTEGAVEGIHTLRHTFATLMILNGMAISEVSRLLGHSNITTTLNRYCGEDKGRQREIIDAMASTMSARVPDDVMVLGKKSA